MSVLSVDLACRIWSELGVVLLEPEAPAIACEIIRWRDPGPPPVVELALRLNTLSLERNATILMLNGSQAWKSQEKQDPGTNDRFIAYCLALYQALGRLGWQRLAPRRRTDRSEPGRLPRILVESYPNAAWKSLGLQPLPAKRDCRVSHLADAYAALTALLPISASQPPNHHQLQAIVGGLPGLTIEERSMAGTRIVGQPPRWVRGSWREGIVALPLPPLSEHRRTKAVRWMIG